MAGGISKEVVVSKRLCSWAGSGPRVRRPSSGTRLALELAHEVDHVDEQLAMAKRHIAAAVAASGTTLTDVFGIGP